LSVAVTEKQISKKRYGGTLMGQFILSIDIGTSACKVAIFDRKGIVIASVNEGYPVYYPKPGYIEQKPDEWWEATCKGIKKVLEKGNVTPDQIVGVGVDGQSWSAIAIDKEGKVLFNNPIWMDTRANDICIRLNQEIGADQIFSVAGNPLQPSYSTAKIRWYQESYPEQYKKIDKILQSNSYIVYKMTNMASQEKSQGYGLHCFHLQKGIWDKEMASSLGIPMSFLPDIYDCHDVVGGVSDECARQTGLLAGTPVVAGGLDAACGTLGAGVYANGQTQEQGGQAGGMSICTDLYTASPKLICSFHVIPDKWLLQGGTTGGGGALRWFEGTFGDYERELAKTKDSSSFALLDELAKQIAPGSDGMIFLPYLAGERSPIWDPDSKGVYYGIDFNKSKAHFVRSLLEGVGFSLLHNLEEAEAVGAHAQMLRAMGGAANSRLWTQIKADITGRRIEVPSSDTATTLGAAILAGMGIGWYASYEEAVKETVKVTRVHEPDMKKHEIYQKNYQTYRRLYEDLKETMHKK